MADSLLMVWSISLVVIILVIYIFKNGMLNLNLHRILRRLSRSNFEKRIDRKLLSLRNRAIPPKKIYPFLPLIPFFIVVYIFMNHYIFFAVITSDSMSPEFERGDIVLMQSVDTEADVDDIIMFENKNPRGIHPPVIHRVVNMTEEGMETKGDAINTIDDWTVQQDEIDAKAVTVFDNKPIVIEDVGGYFIQDYQSNGLSEGKFVFTSLMVAALKDLGIVVFSVCIILYIVLTVRDLNGHNK